MFMHWFVVFAREQSDGLARRRWVYEEWVFVTLVLPVVTFVGPLVTTYYLDIGRRSPKHGILLPVRFRNVYVTFNESDHIAVTRLSILDAVATNDV